MHIFPAIDLRNRQIVRLTQGDYDRMEVYGSDPAAVARGFAQQGAEYLHVVDLDGAKDGALSNFETVAEIIAATGMFVEIGGGIRDEARIRTYLEQGAGRVILGTAALRDFDFLKRMVDKYGEKIAVGVDAKDGFVATDGWINVSAVRGIDFCRQLQQAGVAAVIYTDISRDGAMRGTNLEVYKTLLREAPGLAVTASGGVSSLEDVRALAALGVDAAIVGKAIYTGALALPDVLRAARPEN
ncbi:MAG: 1-(5-phosphoribosyl)-5-[(5-phosphoribosylamino)methylideneamino]imidazole-4-carboxamide isomerase [Subdoligranulum sp.]|nr:1-(5-phosphoribosyl)-5-[(5-phosphoribosylamino)methylideneamino]imidazole-4-carboxamide isomerase [Subdoligranulum sp.]